MTARDSHLLLRALIDEFIRCGGEHAVACPGSRNTPIVLRLAAEERLTTWSQIDERTAGFFALGIAKRTRRPVLLTCTSGTAVANFLPAVIEANEARVPLILLTADRPPELQQIGAGQTIDQTKIYGDNVRWFFDLGVPEATPERMRWVRALACRAYETATAGCAGPVHLNLPLREPLILDAPLPVEEPGGGGRPDGQPWIVSRPPARGGADERGVNPSERRVNLPQRGVELPQRTVAVAGELPHDLGAMVARATARAGIPLLADPLSGARSGPSAIAHYDLILRDPQTVTALRPAAVLRFGDLPTSKPLRRWLDALDGVPQTMVGRDGAWIHPSSQLGVRVTAPVPDVLNELQPSAGDGDRSGWLRQWTDADSAVAHAITEPLMPAGLSEPAVATMLGQFLPPRATLFVAASMPIRDVEEFFPALSEPPIVMANRGANGIDGTIATAFGIAAATHDPVVLLVGDVTVAHDIGSLITAARNGVKLTIVLLNNGGGGIFDFLPVASEGAPFERYVATAPGLDFTAAAELYGLTHTLAESSDAFITALMTALDADRSHLIEVRTDRAHNRRLHADVEAAAVRALAAFSGR